MNSENYLARSDRDDLLEGDGGEFENAETRISRLAKGSLSFPGSQYFDDIMNEKIRSKKLAKPTLSEIQKMTY
jgi:hypothetical protein